jgi:acrylyl-CoA reductase (NADPH)
VNSTWPPPGWRERAWQRLATDLPAELLDEMTVVEPLSRVPELAGSLLSGAVRGRVVVEVAG